MKNKAAFIKIVSALLLLPAIIPAPALADALSPRQLTLSSSAAAAVTTYTYMFHPATTASIGAMKFELCDSPVETDACLNTTTSLGASFTSNSAGLQSVTGISGFNISTGSPPPPSGNTMWLNSSAPQAASAATTITVTFFNVHNPNIPSKEYYSRITTYSDIAGIFEVDYGAVAAATTNQIIVSGTMPESLLFCVGTSGTDCSDIIGSAVSLGVFSPTLTNVATSVMSASTNAGSGYVITIHGTTMTSGSNTLPAMGTQIANSTGCAVSCTSTTGTSEFGTNLKVNNIASAGGAFGSDPTGSGTGTATGGYANANNFRFYDGDIVALVTGPTLNNRYTNSYMVNVGGNQPAGVYTATLTYICTAMF